MRLGGFGMDVSARIAIKIKSKFKLKKRGRLQNPDMTFKIELFGNLLEELNMWHSSCDIHEEDSFEYCESKFVETLKAVRDMRLALLSDLGEYINDCKINNFPIDISLYRIKKQLEESTFELIRGGRS